MIKHELIKTFHSKRSIIIFIILMVISIADNIVGILQTGPDGYCYNIHPAFVSLLSGQAGLICYALYIWIMPITLMLLYCDRSVNEKRIGITSMYLTKIGRKKFFRSKILMSFLLPFIYCAVPLITNLIIYIIFLHDGTSFFGLEKMKINEIGSFFFNSIHNPYITWIVYLFLAMFMFGLLGIMCQSVSLITNDNKTSYIVNFAIWITFFCSDYNMTMIIQPYTEYDYVYALKTFLCFLPFVLVSLFLAYIRTVVRKDEI